MSLDCSVCAHSDKHAPCTDADCVSEQKTSATACAAKRVSSSVTRALNYQQRIHRRKADAFQHLTDNRSHSADVLYPEIGTQTHLPCAAQGDQNVRGRRTPLRCSSGRPSHGDGLEFGLYSAQRQALNRPTASELGHFPVPPGPREPPPQTATRPSSKADPCHPPGVRPHPAPPFPPVKVRAPTAGESGGGGGGTAQALGQGVVGREVDQARQFLTSCVSTRYRGGYRCLVRRSSVTGGRTSADSFRNGLFVDCLHVAVTWQCISGSDLLCQFYVLPHCVITCILPQELPSPPPPPVY